MFGEAMDYRYFNFSDGVAVNSNHRITLNKIKTAEKPPLPEPESPMWLPALGAALFLLAGIAWMVCPSNKNNATDGDLFIAWALYRLPPCADNLKID